MGHACWSGWSITIPILMQLHPDFLSAYTLPNSWGWAWIQVWALAGQCLASHSDAFPTLSPEQKHHGCWWPAHQGKDADFQTW